MTNLIAKTLKTPAAHGNGWGWPALFLAQVFATTALGQTPLSPGELLARHAPAVVTAQFVIKVSATGSLGALLGGGEEFAAEAHCLMIAPRGLAVCSKSALDGLVGLMQRSLGPMVRGAQLTVEVVELEILSGSGERVAARLLATDAQLDLAWIEALPFPGRTFEFVDLGHGVELAVGDPMVIVQRLEEHFGRAVHCHAGSIGGVTSSPRRLYIPTATLELALGFPAFAVDGRLAGLTVLQLPPLTEATGGGTLGLMRQSTELRSVARTVVLPTSAVAGATARVLAGASTQPPSLGSGTRN